jgi:hypothetical protein
VRSDGVVVSATLIDDLSLSERAEDLGTSETGGSLDFKIPFDAI